MKIFKKILLFLSLSINLFSQAILEEQFDYASNLFKEGKYFETVTEIKRLLLFDSLGVYTARGNFYLGAAYKKGGFYGEAIKSFSDASAGTREPDSLFTLKVEIIKCNILRRTTFRALMLVQELEKTNLDSIKKSELNLLKGFTYAFSDKWGEAAEIFYKSGNSKLGEICRQAESEWYSEIKAKILSVILPGAGQFYTGNYLNGIISLGLNALTLYLTIDSFIDDRIFDGIMTGNFLWLRFYTGNIYNAGKFAQENNEEITVRTMKLLQDYKEYSIH